MSHVIRPLTEADAPHAVDIFVATSYTEVPRDAQQRLLETVDHFVSHDPAGSWIAWVDDVPAGFALACRRDDLWILAALFARPERQSTGAGRALFEHALAHGHGAARWMITSSGDPRATRLYASAGLAPHPTLHASGRPDRSTLPAGLDARAVTLDDVERMSRIDLKVRGARRQADLELLLSQATHGLLADGGYVLFRAGDPPVDGVPLTLVATEVDVARRLLWQALAEAESDVLINALTPSRQWAIEIALAARLRLLPGGAFFVRGVPELPAPWIPSGLFG